MVLRVDSPGGSAFGSELVRRELELTRAAGKPVVVSMGDVAASGGYWISTASDEIIADAATVTGSIGVFALLPTADKTLDKLGVHTAGVDDDVAARRRRPAPAARPALGRAGAAERRAHLRRVHDQGRAAARKTTPAKIDAVAQGRVWTGTQAKERGLVDTLGQFVDALRSPRARQPGRQAAPVYIEREPGRFAQLVAMFSNEISALIGVQLDARLGAAFGVAPALARDAGRDLGWVAGLVEHRRPFTAIVHCLCGNLD